MKIKPARDLLTRCPFCEMSHDKATGVGHVEDTPSDGDMTLCNSCGEWCIFDQDFPGGLRKPNDSEYEYIGASDFCRKLRGMWNVVHAMSPDEIQAALKEMRDD